MKAVFLDAGTFPERININLPDGITDWQSYHVTAPADCLARCRDAGIILTNKIVLTADTIAQLLHTRLICVTATGVNNVDLAACRRRGIKVINATNYGNHSIAEHVLMLMLNLIRALPVYQQANRRKAWSDSEFTHDMQAPLQQLHGRTLTIFGAGSLGTAVADVCRALGMQVILAERPTAGTVRPGYTEFRSALAMADAISIHCPLNEQTHDLFNAEVLALCKPSAILINASRGGIVNETALLQALQAGRLAGAGLDVTTTEPPGKDDLIWTLAELPNVIVTPHIAWASDEAMQTLMDQIMTKVEQFLRTGQVDDLCAG